MKKTIVKNDGSTETVEGTAEEIAEYERKLRGEVVEAPKPKGPGLLTDELQRYLDGLRSIPSIPVPQHTSECEITVASRGWWCVNPPRCTCGLFVYPTPYRITYRYTTYPTTTDGIKVGDVLPDPYIVTCNSTFQ